MKVEERRSGRTTGGLIKFLGEVMLNPEKEFTYRDHLEGEYQDNFQELHRMCLDTLKGFIDKLGIKEIDIYQSDGCLKAVSRWKGVYIGEDGTIFKKVD